MKIYSPRKNKRLAFLTEFFQTSNAQFTKELSQEPDINSTWLIAYKSSNVALLLNYDLTKNNKLKPYLGAGIVYNTLHKTKNQRINPLGINVGSLSRVFEVIDNTEQNDFNGSQISLLARIGLEYHLSVNQSLFLEGNYQYINRPIFENSIRFHNIGINMGYFF